MRFDLAGWRIAHAVKAPVECGVFRGLGCKSPPTTVDVQLYNVRPTFCKRGLAAESLPVTNPAVFRHSCLPHAHSILTASNSRGAPPFLSKRQSSTCRNSSSLLSVTNMGLVDYSDSESDSDSPKQSVTAAAPPTKKSFQKLVDKTNPAKIVVSLPSASSADQDAAPSEEPAAKRIKTGGSRFSGFSSFLPAPKAIPKPAFSASGNSSSTPRVGVNLKTSAEAAFKRQESSVTTTVQAEDDQGDGLPARTNGAGGGGLGLKLPPPKASGPSTAQPSIPEGQKPAEEVKLVGKPLMFKPLSVVRKPGKKTAAPKASVARATATTTTATTAALTDAGGPSTNSAEAPSKEPKAVPPPKKKASLFSFADDTPTVDHAPQEDTPYEAEFTSYDNGAVAQDTSSLSYYSQPPVQYESYSQPYAATNNAEPDSLSAIADDLNLDPVARRELFGRGGGGSKATAKSVINFNLDQEYRHNEELRASGALDAQQHNPLRAIKPGKHSLQQLVNQVQTQRDALEENFAKNRATQKQAGSKYGFR